MKKGFLRAWLPVLIWMGIIFSMSTDAGSAEETGGILEPLLRWMWPSISQDTIEWCHFIIRKCGHLSEYAMLAFLAWRALEKPYLSKIPVFSLKLAARAWLIATVYAATDEFHQIFVPSRTASVGDVMIDSTGALIGLFLVSGIQWWRGRRTTSLP